MTETTPQASTISPATISQGIQGIVMRLSGNQMPSNLPNTTGTEEFVSTTVWIFRDRISGQGSPYWPITTAEHHPGLVCKVESDPNGQYKAQLPPGEYTVFAQYNNELYLNAFQGDGSYQSIEVTPEQVVEFNLTHTEQAFF